MIESVNVVGKMYRVTWCDQLADVDPSGDELAWGTTDFVRREIRAWRSPSWVDRLDTLLHEIGHAIRNELKALGAGLDEEAFVATWAAAWADTMIRNGLVGVVIDKVGIDDFAEEGL